MSHNTIALNKQRQPLDHLDSVWLFGYGSLIYQADFPFSAIQTGLHLWLTVPVLAGLA